MKPIRTGEVKGGAGGGLRMMPVPLGEVKAGAGGGLPMAAVPLVEGRLVPLVDGRSHWGFGVDPSAV